jgi:hypothetical protein
MMAGENNGEIWEWHTSTGWKIVPGSEAAGPNGLEISKDGKWLYVGGWGTQSFIRLSRGQTPVKKDSVPVGFRVDNIRWAPDGTLLAAGQGGTAPSQTSDVARVNPATLKFQQLVHHPDIDGFGVSTNVRHHIKEEENEVFPKAKEAAIDFEALSEAMIHRKKALLANGVPPAAEDAMVATSHGKGDSPARAAHTTKSRAATSRSKT